MTTFLIYIHNGEESATWFTPTYLREHLSDINVEICEYTVNIQNDNETMAIVTLAEVLLKLAEDGLRCVVVKS